MTKVLINGISAEYIKVDDRAIHYGDGLFETILCCHNKLYYWSQHYFRLQSSAEKLKINCPDEQLLLADINQLLAQNEVPGIKNYAIKIILTRGAGERGYQFAKNMKANRLLMLSALEVSYSSLLSEQLLSGNLTLCEQQVSINESLAGLKHLNRLENVLARNEWNNTIENNFIDGLMKNANQHVIEGTMSNLFAVKDDSLFTPDLSQSGVRGIMREMIINLAKINDIQTSIVKLSVDDLLNMDELFISNSLIGMKAVNKLGSCQYRQQNMTKLIFNKLLRTRNNYAKNVY